MKHPVLMTNASDFHCYRCGVYIDSGDVWQTHCDRCAELTELEREIGQLLLGERFLDHIAEYPFDDVCERAYTELFKERTALIARWRQLHAEGAA